MKIATVIARLLLGLIFLVFGLNGFFQFIPAPMPTGLAGQFLQTITVSHFAVLIFVVQILGGVLLLTNQFVPLALAILGPVIVNILNFHITMAPETSAPAIVVLVLWLVVAYSARAVFLPLLANKVPVRA